MDLGRAQAFFGRLGRADGVQIHLANLDNTWRVTDELRKIFPYPPYQVRNWIQINQAASAGFAMLKTVYSLVLVMLIAVAAFNLVAMLIMVVMEKRKDIAILMTMGATRGAIRRIFLIKGLIVGAAGTIAGLLLGAMGCFTLAHYHFIHIPREIYGISTLPVCGLPGAFAWVAAGGDGCCASWPRFIPRARRPSSCRSRSSAGNRSTGAAPHIAGCLPCRRMSGTRGQRPVGRLFVGRGRIRAGLGRQPRLPDHQRLMTAHLDGACRFRKRRLAADGPVVPETGTAGPPRLRRQLLSSLESFEARSASPFWPLASSASLSAGLLDISWELI